MSKQTTLLNSLKAGKEYTAKQITGSFGIAHPASAIRNLLSRVSASTLTKLNSTMVLKLPSIVWVFQASVWFALLMP